MMSNHIWVNPKHVFMTPSKNIHVLLKALDEILLRLLFHACSDPGKLL